MGIANSLRRRYATFEEIPHFTWKENESRKVNIKEDIKAIGGVFGNIIPKGNAINKVDLPSTVMTWDKFQRTVLPSADSIEVKVDNANRLMALVTASDETSLIFYNGTIHLVGIITVVLMVKSSVELRVLEEDMKTMKLDVLSYGKDTQTLICTV